MQVQCALAHREGLCSKQRYLSRERMSIQHNLSVVLEGILFCANLEGGEVGRES